ncbi:MAG: chemotaxis protein CheW [Gammaproteobacteria bacterium]|nr:chemotaxis protein CheW [Gammaproteobacteria bacterium]
MSGADKKAMKSSQHKAIDDYLQALLLEVDDELPQEPQYQESQPQALGLEQLVAEIPEIIAEVQTEPEQQVELAEAEPEIEIATEVMVQTSLEENEHGVPNWAAERFQCLMFMVSGLQLAVPLVKLNSVIPWTKKIVETPNQTEWYLGLVQHLGKSVKVIDTALMVLPENRRQGIAEAPEDRFSHILLVNDSQWGLACDSIGEVIWLTEEEVKWRKNKQQRPWLAGTSLEHLCAVIDTEVFAQMLNQQVSA